ncbi:hypothetical protein QQS21_008306 [Conoideocrella luteorostrata]|uniref:Uncharacterized protein n=1 Tax=Conoideocrella luteorostrata TaxID=1105319 RepID=A0AAJ0CJA5_9HYPO|nr:hypothetical protein QQS21_008306 [Conoideocrella luteorostrata]
MDSPRRTATVSSGTLLGEKWVVNNATEGSMTKQTSQKYMAKKTPRRRPSSMARPRLPPMETWNSHVPATASPAAYHHYGLTPPSYPYYEKPGVPSSSQWTRQDASNSGQPWSSGSGQNFHQGSSQMSTQLPGLQAGHGSQNSGAVSFPNDIYAFGLGGPVLQQPPVPHQKSIDKLTLPVTTSYPPTSNVLRSQPVPTASKPTGLRGYNAGAVIDLTQDNPSPNSTPTRSPTRSRRRFPLSDAKSTKVNSQFDEDPFVDSPSTNQGKCSPDQDTEHTATNETIYVATEHEERYGKEASLSPSVSAASSELPSTMRICEILDNSTTSASEINHELVVAQQDDSETTDGCPQARDIMSSSRAVMVEEGAEMECITENHHENAAENIADDLYAKRKSTEYIGGISQENLNNGERTPTPEIGIGNKEFNASPFDSTAFDVAIYQQTGAVRPPPEVVIGAKIIKRPISPRKDERRYIHVNPAIHQMHNGSRVWYERKTREIQARRNRKCWFGKVAARLRWLQKNKIRDQTMRREVVRNGEIPKRLDPQPRTYSRLLDIGHVSESELPEHVRQNPEWFRGYKILRQNHQERERWQRYQARERRRIRQERERQQIHQERERQQIHQDRESRQSHKERERRKHYLEMCEREVELFEQGQNADQD